MAPCTPPATASCATTAAVRSRRAPPLALLAVGVAALAALALAPAPAAATQKPGACPRLAGPHECAFRCYEDEDCAGELKCCSTACGGSMCITPVVLPRPLPTVSTRGGCPVVSSTPWVCQSRCATDADCREGHKCCLHHCGGYACRLAIAPSQ